MQKSLLSNRMPSIKRIIKRRHVAHTDRPYDFIPWRDGPRRADRMRSARTMQTTTATACRVGSPVTFAGVPARATRINERPTFDT